MALRCLGNSARVWTKAKYAQLRTQAPTTRTAALPGSHPSRRRYAAQVAPQPHALSWSDLLVSCKLARWSGYCYKPSAMLPDLLESEGLQMVAHGRTHYTSWIIADGCIDFGAHVDSVLSSMSLSEEYAARCKASLHASVRRTISAMQGSSHTSPTSPLPHTSQPHDDGHAQQQQQQQQQWQSPRQRFVFIRGVQWNAPDSQVGELASTLANFLPTGFPPKPAEQEQAAEPPLVAHRGVARHALDLFGHLLPYLQPSPPAMPSSTSSSNISSSTNSISSSSSSSKRGPAEPSSRPTEHSTVSTGLTHTTANTTACEPLPVSFAGHSLGGALCLLLLTLLRAHTNAAAGVRRQAPKKFVPGQELPLPHKSKAQVQGGAALQPQVHAFGAPPVLAHRDGGGGYKVLQELGLPDHSIRSFVQQHDPIPRVLLTADPAYNAMVKFVPGMQQVLALRGWLLGGVASSLSGDTADARGTAAILTPNRFMYENVGSVYLIKAGSEVTPMGSPEMDDWSSTSDDMYAYLAAQPARALKGWLDHNSSSYQHDLEIACLITVKRDIRRVLQPQRINS